MNLLDYALIALVAMSVIAAAGKGLVYELWMMAITVTAIELAAWYDVAVAARLGNWWSPAARRLAAFGLVLGAVLFVGMLLGRLLRGMLHAIGLKWPDRVLGAGLGLVRGLLLAAALLLIWTVVPLSPRFLRGSRLAPRLAWASRGLAACLPHGWRERFAQGRAELERGGQ